MLQPFGRANSGRQPYDRGTRRAFEDDRAKDAALQAAGYVVVRFTWRQIREEPLRVAAQLA